MTPTFNTLGALFHHLYETPGNSLVPYAQFLERTSRQMFERSTISSQLNRAKTLLGISTRLLRSASLTDDEMREQMELFQLLIECYDVVTDDLMLLSSFEIFAKSRILRKGYIVHEIDSPEDLKKLQRKQPIHIRTIRAKKRHGENVNIREYTLGIETLLKPRYRRLYPIDGNVKIGLQEIRSRRNLVHFPGGGSWTVTKEALAVVEYLDKHTPRFKAGCQA